MKRSAALAILSRDHHQALVMAQMLKRSDGAGAAAARTRFLEFWNQECRRHFQLEEELLLPAFAMYGDARDPLVLRVLGDHVEIRARAAQLAAHEQAPDAAAQTRAGATRPAGNEQAPDIAALHELGAMLAAHVRLEERELFVLIERVIPPEDLLRLARALALEP